MNMSAQTTEGIAADSSAIVHAYSLLPGSKLIVAAGARVERGDVLAERALPPVLVAVAAELGVTHLEDVAQRRSVGSSVRTGEYLASMRRGLRVAHAVAPVSGTIAAQSPLGIITLAPENRTVQIRARFAGTVVSSDDRGISVLTPTTRIPFAYGMQIAMRAASLIVDSSLLAQALTHRTTFPPVAADAACVVAYVGDMQTLAYARQRAGALLIIGAVGESVAWELCTGAGPNSMPSSHGALVVLAGPGSADDGVRAVTPLQNRNGAMVTVDRETRNLVLIEESTPALLPRETATHEMAITFRPPAAWDESGAVAGTVHEHSLKTGLRLLAIETHSAQHGAVLTPIENFGKSR